MKPKRGATLYLVASLLCACDGGGDGEPASRGGSPPPPPPSRPNNSPVGVLPDGPMLVAAAAPIYYDATQGGTAFTDAEEDPLTYLLFVTSPAQGLTIQGTNVIGTLAVPGVVNFKFFARDPWGGEAVREFSFAVAAAEPAEPLLPAVSFVYEHALLPLPVHIPRVPIDHWDPELYELTNAGATLGRVLFYDKRLSITNTHSCASCHRQAHSFAAPERFSTGVSNVLTRRNVMSLTNVWINSLYYFSDSTAQLITHAVKREITHPEVLGNSFPMLEEKLAATDFYPPLFTAAFGSPEVTEDRIARALAQFLRSIISYQTTFDIAQGPIGLNAYTDQEWRGAQVFKDKGCAGSSCHAHATLTSSYAQNIGLDAVSTDPGSYGGRFRTASLKNIAATAPYMHDGRFTTLLEVIEHYDYGIIQNPALFIGFRTSTGAPYRLNLSGQQKVDLEAFLHTLTDQAVLTDQRWSDPFPY